MKAQGALEYIIVIATALAVTGIVSALVIDYFGPQQAQYNYATCRQAASTCKTVLGASPGDSCSFCNSACNYSNGTEIFPNATSCCRLGKSGEIYEGSQGCSYCSSDNQCPWGLCCSHQCKTQACAANSDCSSLAHDACHYYECQGSGTCGAKCVLKSYPGCCLQDTECQDIPYDCATPKCVKLNPSDTYTRCNYTATAQTPMQGGSCGPNGEPITTTYSCDGSYVMRTVTYYECGRYPNNKGTCVSTADTLHLKDCSSECQICSNGACVNATETQCSTSPLQSCAWVDCKIIYNKPWCTACLPSGQGFAYCNNCPQSQE